MKERLFSKHSIGLKAAILALGACCSSFPIFSQTHYNANISVGVKGGVDLSRVNFTPSVKQGFVLGGNAGLTFRYIAAFMRMMIKDILTKNGYNVAGEAENGAKAVEKYNELKPDLVLMDITMPEMDGIQALKKIKENDPGAMIIMCSAMGQQAMVIESIQSGAKDFIVKPFQADRVLEAVKKVVG